MVLYFDSSHAILKSSLFVLVALVVTLCPGMSCSWALQFEYLPISVGSNLDNSRVFAVGDFNRDGKLDVVGAIYRVPPTEDSGAVYGVPVWLQSPDSTPLAVSFSPLKFFPLGLAHTTGVAVKDFNHDNFPDVVIYSRTLRKLVVYLNQKNDEDGEWLGLDQTRDSEISIDLGGTDGFPHPSPILSNDFNSDGRPDLVVGNFAPILGTNQIDFAILLNLGVDADDNFNFFHTPLEYQAGGIPRGQVTDMAMADFDGNGASELVILQSTTGNHVPTTVSIYQFNENFSVTGQLITIVPAGTNMPTSYSLAVGDLDGDNRPDLAVLGFKVNQNRIYTLKNVQNINGGMTLFAPPNVISLIGIEQVRGLDIADLDLDGDSDIAFGWSKLIPPTSTGPRVSKVGILVNDGGVFSAPQSFDTGDSEYFLKIRDINNDGLPDILTANIGYVSSPMGPATPGSITALINRSVAPIIQPVAVGSIKNSSLEIPADSKDSSDSAFLERK